MARNDDNARDLEWALQGLESGTLDPHSISFFLSQPSSSSSSSSSSSQETQNSINLNISKNNLPLFSQFLKALSKPKGTTSCLRNLEFHLIQWELHHMKEALTLLQTNPTIKKLMFNRNTFTSQTLTQLSEALKHNRSVEELVLSESSIGTQGAEELSKMIEVNSSLKVLTVFDSSSSKSTMAAAPLISAVLARNRSMEVNVWGVDSHGTTRKAVEFSHESSTLRVHRLDVSGACRVACSLGFNSTVTSLNMTGVRLESRWAKQFRWVLEQNRTLKEVNLSNTCLKDKGVVYVAAGLFKNQRLEKLYLDGNCHGGIGVEHLLCPLTKFSPLQNQANVTLKCLTMGGGRSKIGRDGHGALVQMLSSNETVSSLGIHDDESLKPENVVEIFKSLETNAALRRLSVAGCKGVKGDGVLNSIMAMLDVNPWIEDIDLDRTPLHVSGKAEAVYQRLSQREKSCEPEIDDDDDDDMLKGLQITMPKNCRVFLCGQQFSGKTTLCDSISRSISPSKVPYLDQVRILVNPVEQAVRTPGMKIKTFKEEGMKISIWNLAGQHESYSLHDLMFPGPSFFLIISSLFKKPSDREPKSEIEIEEDIHYWLRFVVSNSKRALQQCMLPNVTIVLTHSDKMDQQFSSLEGTMSVIQRLREKFKGFLEFHPNVFTVDARSSASVTKLSHHIKKTSKTVLERVPRVYQLCNDVAELLSEWKHENHNKPVMRWKEFEDLCQLKVPSLRIRSRNDNKEKAETRRKAVATSLHQIGEVIYFDDLCFFILDCEWFCGEVLSQLTRLDVRKQSSNGFISRKDMEKTLIGSLHSSSILGMGLNVLENLEAKDLIQMMLKLELCCELNPSDPNSPLLIPPNLEEGRRKPKKWEINSSDNNYVGRSLQCDDSSHMFLTPAFFPRLQVHLHNKVMELKNQHGASCSLEKYLILININGIHIRVEFGGRFGHSVDVLACSTKSTTEMLRLFHQLIFPAIQSLCHGITLMEHVLRSVCVKNLIPPRFRRNQSVPLQQLKRELLSVPADSIYDYQHTWGSVIDSGSQIIGHGFDFARDLLSEDDFREVLHCRYHDLYNLAMELQVENTQEHPPTEEIASSIEPSFAGIAKGVEAVLQRLKIIEEEIRDVKQEIQGLRYYEHRLLIELI